MPVNPKSLNNLRRDGWAPGKSGNPGGRPSIATALRAAGTDTAKLTAELAEQLIACMRTVNKTEASWRFAVEQLANRLWGKPKESMDLNVSDATRTAIDWSLVPIERRRELLAAAAAIGALEVEDAGDTEH